MNKRILSLCLVLMLGAAFIACSKKEPPYDAKVIDPSEVDSPAQQVQKTPAAGGGKAINERQW